MKLISLNAAQYSLESIERDIQTLRQLLFDQYWIFTADLAKYRGLATYEGWRSNIAKNVSSIQHLIASNLQMVAYHTSNITPALDETNMGYAFPLKYGTSDGFYMQADPTVMIAGAGSQYGQDPIKNLPVRLDGSDMYTVASGMNTTVDALGMYFTSPLNSDMPFSSLNLDRGTGKEPRTPAIARALAEGHLAVINGYDPKSQPYYGLERFTGSNGWFPLFLEYEVEYINIPYEYWTFQPCGPEGRIGYCLKDGIDIS